MKTIPRRPRVQMLTSVVQTPSEMTQMKTTNETTIPKEKLNQIVENLRSGTSSIPQESAATGFIYRTIQSALKKLLGAEGYTSLIVASRGQKKVRMPGTPREPAAPRLDDVGLPTVDNMSTANGWSWRRVREHEPRAVAIPLKEGKITILDAGDHLIIVIDPKGKEFIQALPNEKADLLRVHPLRPDAPPLRFVEYSKSAWKKRIDKNTDGGIKDLEHGQVAQLQRKLDRVNGDAPKLIIEVAHGITSKLEAAAKKAVKKAVKETPKSKAVKKPVKKTPKGKTVKKSPSISTKSVKKTSARKSK